MDETRELFGEMAGIIEDLCRNQAKTLKRIADCKDLPDSVREIVLERVKYMELSHHKIRMFVEKVKRLEEPGPRH